MTKLKCQIKLEIPMTKLLIILSPRLPPLAGGSWREGDSTLTLPHPNPLQQVERELPARERKFGLE